MKRIILWTAIAACAQAQPRRLTLKQAEEFALNNHPRISAARNRAEAAALVPDQVRADNLPFVTGNITGAGALDRSRIAAGGLNNPVIYDRFASGINAGMVISDFGRNRELVESARSRAGSQRQLTETTRAEIVFQVDRAFYALLRAQALLKVAAKTVAARKLVADQVGELVKSNLKSTLDGSFANVNLAEATLLLEQQHNEEGAAQAGLAAALGTPTQERYELVDDNPLTPPDDDLAAMIQRASQKRPELASLRFDETAARQFARAESRLKMPTITALTSVGVMPAHVAELSNRWAAIGANMTIPIFNGHLFESRKAQAELQARAAADRVKDAELQVSREVRVAYLNALSAHQRVGLAAKLLDQSTMALDLAKTRYELGLSSIVELSQAELSLTRAELAVASARFDYLALRADLNFQIGENR